MGIRLDQLSQPLPPLSLYVSHAVVLGSGESNPTLSLCLLGDPQVSKAIGMPILQCTQKRCAHRRKQLISVSRATVLNTKINFLNSLRSWIGNSAVDIY